MTDFSQSTQKSMVLGTPISSIRYVLTLTKGLRKLSINQMNQKRNFAKTADRLNTNISLRSNRDPTTLLSH